MNINFFSFGKINLLGIFAAFSLCLFFHSGIEIVDAQNISSLIPKEDNIETDATIKMVQENTAQIGGLQDVYYWIFRGNAGSPIGFLEIAYSIIGTIAVFMLIIEAAKIILSQGEEEAINQAKTQIGYILVGVIFLGAAIPIVELFMDPNKVGLFNVTNIMFIAVRMLNPIITFLQILLGGILLYSLVRIAMGYILAQGSDEAIEKQMNSLKNLGFGFLMALFATPLVDIFFPVIDAIKDGNVLPEDKDNQFLLELVGIIEMVFVFVGIAAFTMLIVASFYLVSSFGNEEMISKAKRIIIGCVAGILMSIFAYVIVGFLLPS